MFILLILLSLLSIAAAHFARQQYEGAIAKGRRFMIPGGDTAGELVQEFLDSRGAHDVKIVTRNVLASNSYEPGKHMLVFSPNLSKGTDAAALAETLHEAAHALQGQASPAELRWRLSTVRLTRYGPTVIILAMVILKFCSKLPFRIPFMIVLACCTLIMIMNVMSLPIEFNASQRALQFLESKYERHSRFVETMTKLLRGVAFRDTGAFIRSPFYCFQILARRRNLPKTAE